VGVGGAAPAAGHLAPGWHPRTVVEGARREPKAGLPRQPASLASLRQHRRSCSLSPAAPPPPLGPCPPAELDVSKHRFQLGGKLVAALGLQLGQQQLLCSTEAGEGGRARRRPGVRGRQRAERGAAHAARPALPSPCHHPHLRPRWRTAHAAGAWPGAACSTFQTRPSPAGVSQKRSGA
jgi:hypothetical protein